MDDLFIDDSMIKIKKNKELIRKLKPFWKEMRMEQSKFHRKLAEIEKRMEKATKIEGMEFFWCDDGIVGIGNTDRTLELISDSELEGD